jgi:D-alanyl-D-alanine carboxypeptidase/D-alanyl-D-alanine-endopeptidase (penicillin-binding protein 4)
VDAAVASLREDLDRILRRANFLTDRASLLVVSLDRGDTLFAHNADRPLAPASNLKLFTSAAGLFYLGPEFRYNTYLLANGPIRDGVLEGDLVLYGTGDPTLSDRFGPDVMDAFADTLVAMGIREIRGSIIGDASFFEGSGLGDGWQTSYSNAVYAAPASALSYSENIGVLEVRPGPSAGTAAVATLLPGGKGIQIRNEVRTIASGRSSVRVTREGYAGPIVVSGQISRRTSRIRWSVPVAEPARFAASALKNALVERGVVAEGEVKAISDRSNSPISGRSLFAPALQSGSRIRVLAIHTSPRLLDVLEVVNKRSNNFMAEQVIRTVGRVARGRGSVTGGASAFGHFAEEAGIAAESFEVHDGSGLSALNRTSARSVIALLSYVADSPIWTPFWHTLPETGAPDGLRRMIGTPAEGRLRAKTGTINQVSALSGYVRAAGGERLIFSILNNRTGSAWAAKRVEDQIGARLAQFERPASNGVPDPPEPAH